MELQQGTVGVDAPSGMRNVQSMHTFIPQAGPAPGPPQVQQDMRPHSWDNSGGHLSNMAMQSQLLHQLNPQLLASLSSQVLMNMHPLFPAWQHSVPWMGMHAFRELRTVLM